MFSFVVMELKRNPKEFWDALHRIDKIAACRRAMKEAGLPETLLFGAGVYIPPEHHRRTLEHLSECRMLIRLSARHIIVAEEVREDVVDAIASIPRRGKLQIQVVRVLPFEIGMPHSVSLNGAVRRHLYRQAARRHPIWGLASS